MEETKRERTCHSLMLIFLWGLAALVVGFIIFGLLFIHPFVSSL